MQVSAGPRRGFTLIELLVVMAAIGVLLAVTAPRYMGSTERAREAALRQNLSAVREAIDYFRGDRMRYPADLKELVQLRYLRAVPVDPITERTDTWVQVPSQERGEPGMANVRSGAPGSAANGSPYATW